MQLVVHPDGQVRCIYDEKIDLTALGQLSITRASHVEPDSDGNWWADLRGANGPIIGPFAKRSAALIPEVAWLEAHWLMPCPQQRGQPVGPERD